MTTTLERLAPHPVVHTGRRLLRTFALPMLLFWAMYFLQPLPPMPDGDDGDDA